MRTREQRAGDIAAAWAALRERARGAPGVRETGEWGSGESFAVRRLGLKLDVIAYVELIEGELWLQLCVGVHDATRDATLTELDWVRDAFHGGDDRRAIIVRSPEAHRKWPAIWVPLERWPLPALP